MELFILHRRLVAGPSRYRYAPPAPRRPRVAPVALRAIVGTYAAVFMALIAVSVGG